MIRVIQFLADSKLKTLQNLSEWLCARTKNHKEIFYNPGGLEPDWRCQNCPGYI